MKPWADELNIDQINKQFLRVSNHGVSVPEGFTKAYGANKDDLENGVLNPRSLRINETNNLVSSITGGRVISEEVVEATPDLISEDKELNSMFSAMLKDSGKMHDLMQANQGFAKDAQRFGAKKLTKAFIDLEKAWSNYHTELGRIAKQVKDKA